MCKFIFCALYNWNCLLFSTTPIFVNRKVNSMKRVLSTFLTLFLKYSYQLWNHRQFWTPYYWVKRFILVRRIPKYLTTFYYFLCLKFLFSVPFSVENCMCIVITSTRCKLWCNISFSHFVWVCWYVCDCMQLSEC